MRYPIGGVGLCLLCGYVLTTCFVLRGDGEGGEYLIWCFENPSAFSVILWRCCWVAAIRCVHVQGIATVLPQYSAGKLSLACVSLAIVPRVHAIMRS